MAPLDRLGKTRRDVRDFTMTLGAISVLLPALLTGVFAAPSRAAAQSTGSYKWIAVMGTGGTFAPTAGAACKMEYDYYRPSGPYYGYTPGTVWWTGGCEWGGIPYAAGVDAVCSDGSLPGYNNPYGTCPLTTSTPSPAQPSSCTACNGGIPAASTPRPIDILSGDKQFVAEDFANASRTLWLKRIYNSTPFTGLVTTLNANPLGLANWLFDFQFELQIANGWSSNQAVLLLTPGGAAPAFQMQTGGAFTSYTGSGYSTPQTDYTLAFVGTMPSNLAAQPTTWTLTGPDDTIYTLTTVLEPGTGAYSTARPVSIKYRNGVTWTLTYGGGSAAVNQLTSVADNFGNTISFSWITNSVGSPMAISSVSIAASATPSTPHNYAVQYTYNAAAGTAPGTMQPDALAGVAYLDNNGTVQDSTTYEYGNSSFPLAITAILDNADVQRWGVTYDATGRATVSSVTGAASGPLSYQVAYTTIPSAGGTFTRTVTNPLGKQSIYNYLNSASQGLQLTSIANQASSLSPASTRTYTYGSDAFVASITDEDGNVETQTHDPRGMPSQTVEASGTSSARTTTIAWDSLWRQPDTTTTAVSMTTMAYNSVGAPTSKTITDETTFTVPYSTNGRTRTWTYAWTSGGEISAIHGPLWVSGGMIDTTSFAYSANGYLQTLANALGQTTTVTAWDWRGAPTNLTDPNGVVTTLTYDIHGRLLTSTINPGSAQSEYQFAYDAVGDLTQVTLPMGATLQYQYDQAERMVKVTNVRGETRTYAYDNATDPLSLVTQTSGGTTTQTHTGVYDDWGRLLQSIGAASQTWNLAYDNLSNLLSVTDPPIGSSPGNERQNAYDPLNRVITQTDPQGATLGYAYNVADNLTAFTDALSSTTNRTVDGFGEIIQEISPARGAITSWYDGGGNLTKTVDADSIETDFTYDAANRRTAMSAPGAISAAYAYDATTGGNFGIGRLTSASEASDSVAYVYDAQGRVIGDSKVIADSGYGTAFNVTYAYDANGKVIAVTYPSGDVVNITRATDGQITGVTETLSGGSAQTVASSVTFEPYGPLSGLTYGNGLVLTRAYNADYNLTGITTAPSSGSALLNVSFSWRADWRIAGVTDSAGTGRGASFGYTNSGRVSSAAGPWGSQSFAYDANGNWTSATATGPPAAGTQSFAYDGFKRLKTVTGGATTLSYAYDYLGRNDWSSTAAGPVAFIYDTDGHLIAEHNASSGAMQREYIWIGDQMAGIVDNSTGTPALEAVTTGQIDEPLLVTAADQSPLFDGYVDPYGNQGTLATTSYTMNMRLPGQYFQAGSGLSQNGWRDYDPTIGRYIEGDPIGINGGQNVYAYVDGDPLNQTDQWGLATYAGQATYYGPGIPNPIRADGKPFDPSSMSAAMFPGRARLGTPVTVQLMGGSKCTITVIVNDTGPFARDARGRALRPLQPDPNTVIDLTPSAFRKLTGGLTAGRVPVVVTVPDQ